MSDFDPVAFLAAKPAASPTAEPTDDARPSWLTPSEPKLASKTAVAGPGIGKTPGLVEPGNIDLTARPDVANADGTHSSVRSMSFSEGGPEILIPTVPDDGSHIMSDDEAIAQYRKTGKHLGKFTNPTFADEYASRLHRQQAAAGPGGSAAQVAALAPPASSDAGFDPVAFLSAPTPKVSSKPAAPFIPVQTPTFGESAKAGASALASPFVDAAKGLWAANSAAGRAITSPVEGFRGSPLARVLGLSTPDAVTRNGAELRQAMRGVNANIPFANKAIEYMGGPPAVSAADAAAAPGAQDFGGVVGLPIGGMEGEIAGNAARGLVRGARAFGEGARTLGERSIARSVARGETPLKDALVHVGDEALEKGHIMPPLVRAGAVATDEAAAALARRLLTPRTAAPLVETARAAMPDAFADPIDYAALRDAAAAKPRVGAATGASGVADPIDYAALQDAATAKPVRRGPIATEAAAPPENPQILQLQDALKGATKEQADMINKAIAGLQAKAAAPRLSLVPGLPSEQLAPTLAERAAATRDAPMRSSAVTSAREALAAPPPSAPPAPLPEAPRLPPAQSQAAPAPGWEPSKSDERFAKKLKMTVDEYRATMARKYGGPPEALVGTPEWSPSDEDAVFAHRVGLSVPDYRALMSKRMAGIAAGRIR